MNNNNYIFWDLETSSTNPDTTQVLSVGAVIVDPRNLEIIPNSEFYSLVKPEDESTVEEGALKANKLTLEELRDKPVIDVVWRNFSSFINNYKVGKSKWGLPISSGFNIVNFDMIIAKRINNRFGIKEMFHPRDCYDCMMDYFRFCENDPDIDSISFDSFRKRTGLSAVGAHSALVDARQAAEVGTRFLKMYRSIKLKFEGAFVQR